MISVCIDRSLKVNIHIFYPIMGHGPFHRIGLVAGDETSSSFLRSPDVVDSADLTAQLIAWEGENRLTACTSLLWMSSRTSLTTWLYSS